MEVFATVAEEVTDPQEATASLKTMAMALGNRHAEDGTMTTTVCWTCGYDSNVTSRMRIKIFNARILIPGPVNIYHAEVQYSLIKYVYQRKNTHFNKLFGDWQFWKRLS